MIPTSIPIPLPGGLHGPLPRFYEVAQKLSTDKVDDIDAVVAAEFAKFAHIDLAGKSIAVGVGSRGIRDQPAVVTAVIRELKAAGAVPFIVPAMGSHGGGTSEGQTAVLASYGFTEDAMGVPIKASMEVVELAQLEDGTPVYCDKLAHAADYIVACGRVKPHTSFRAKHESGIVKMLAIGLAKHEGATALHFHGMERFDEILPPAAALFLANANVLFGVAMVENSREDMNRIELVAPEDFFERDAELVKLAAANMPKLLFSAIDLLIVDELGKNVSGAGMDPNVTGRTGMGLANFSDGPEIRRIVVRDLTDVTEGNATGLGTADVVTQRFVSRMDWVKTYVNVVTSGSLDGAKLPIVADTDRDAIGIGIRGCSRVASDQARIVRVRNTLEMTTVWASEMMLDDIESNPRLEILSGPFEVEFDDQGRLLGTIDLH